jgi:predicted RNA-binding protein Jag
MGSYERFVIHDYLKDRDGVYTESEGEEGKNRHVVIHPHFGRMLKKAKRRLSR